jgi:hypothetical protein
MKKTKFVFALLIAAFSLTATESCKNKKKAETTQTSDAPVIINSDNDLRSSVNTVVKDYNGVQAEVNDGVIVLRGSIKQEDLQKLMQRVHELRPKKVDNTQIVIIK